MDFSLYTFSDALEITFFILGFYIINSWLFNQEKKKLLIYWYSYHALVIGSYVCELSTVLTVLGGCFPVVLILCIVLQEQRLQKMFVVAQRMDPLLTTTTKSYWTDELIKFALIRLNEQKDVRVIIERNDSIGSLLNAGELINADLKKNTLELLYTSLSLPKESFLWVTVHGNIVSLAAVWKDFSFADTLQITAATDCLALHACAATRKFTIMQRAQILENLSAQHALALMQELSPLSLKKQEGNHVTKTDFTHYNNTTLS